MHREILEHNGYKLPLSMSKMAPTSQTIVPNFGSACGLCSINNGRRVEESAPFFASIAAELSGDQRIIIQEHIKHIGENIEDLGGIGEIF